MVNFISLILNMKFLHISDKYKIISAFISYIFDLNLNGYKCIKKKEFEDDDNEKIYIDYDTYIDTEHFI